MKKVLFITYYFPPSGGPGVQRVLKHIKYIRSFGWEPVVLTVANGQYPAIDASLEKQVPGDIKVYKTHIFEPYDIYRRFTGKEKGTALDVNNLKKEGQKRSFTEKIAEFIRATFFIPDARMFWRFTAVKEALAIIEKEGIEAVYSSSPPYTCSLIARGIKRKTGLPWIAGFRDPWTGFLTTPNRWFMPKAIDRAMERSVFEEADLIESAWEGITKDALGKYPALAKEKFIHIPNGFDSEDFPPHPDTENKKFTLTYTGSMYGRRNPAALFAAMNILIKEGKIDPGKILLRFVGRFGAEVEEMIENASFRSSIETVSYVPHQKSLEYLFGSDILLLIVDEAKESEEIVPGKVYEYIAVKKPILAVAPVQSAIAALLQETSAGMAAHQSDIRAIADIFLSYYQEWESGDYKLKPDTEKIKQYERKEAAGKLAGLLDSLVKS